MSATDAGATGRTPPSDGRLARGAGRWRGEERFPAPDGSGEQVAEAISESRLQFDDRLLVTDYRQTLDGEVVMEGHSVMSWVPSLEAVVMYFFDASGEPPSVYRGDWDGDALVLEGPGPEGTRIRHRTTHPAPDRMRTESEMSFDGGQSWTRVFVGEYERED